MAVGSGLGVCEAVADGVSEGAEVAVRVRMALMGNGVCVGGSAVGAAQPAVNSRSARTAMRKDMAVIILRRFLTRSLAKLFVYVHKSLC